MIFAFKILIRTAHNIMFAAHSLCKAANTTLNNWSNIITSSRESDKKKSDSCRARSCSSEVSPAVELLEPDRLLPLTLFVAVFAQNPVTGKRALARHILSRNARVGLARARALKTPRASSAIEPVPSGGEALGRPCQPCPDGETPLRPVQPWLEVGQSGGLAQVRPVQPCGIG